MLLAGHSSAGSQGRYQAAGYRAAGDGSWLAHLSSAWPLREGWISLLESTSSADYLPTSLVSHRSQPAWWEDRESTTRGRRWVKGCQHQCSQLLPGPFQVGTQSWSYLQASFNQRISAKTKSLVPLSRGPRERLYPTSQSPFHNAVVVGPAQGPGKHNQHCVFKTTSVQMLFPW